MQLQRSQKPVRWALKQAPLLAAAPRQPAAACALQARGHLEARCSSAQACLCRQHAV
jgi:hypothetical protein